ncbi:hypothetical protein ACWGCI_10185 [Streptomyces sp. NPDC054949]
MTAAAAAPTVIAAVAGTLAGPTIRAREARREPVFVPARADAPQQAERYG